VQIIQGDVLSSKHRLMPEVVEAVDQCSGGESSGIKLVANLPYRVATPVLMNLLLNHTAVRRLCFTVQAEVGERLVAQPGTKAYGPLSIITQMLCSMETLTRIRAKAFWPQPAIDSVMMRMDVNDVQVLDAGEIQSFAELVRKTFDHRRKTIRSALGYVVDELQRDKVCREFDPVRRPESFKIEEWLEIYRIVNRD
jgi:16S rRNA (adenine1518-N6/adenine1519-N6)-dimethyltransferase